MKIHTLLHGLGLCMILCIVMGTTPASAFPMPNPQACGYICSNSNASCDEGCSSPAGWITCGQYWGNPGNDLDGDGVSNSIDNCRCTPNANQADCDNDSRGNACDTTDNSWYLTSVDPGTCYVDVDDHGVYDTVEVYGKKVWRSRCGGGTCTSNWLQTSFDCPFWKDLGSCCKDKLGQYARACNIAWNYDGCGYPKCPF